jgi:hypothetical protein
MKQQRRNGGNNIREPREWNDQRNLHQRFPTTVGLWPEIEIGEIFPNFESQTECLFSEFDPTQFH